MTVLRLLDVAACIQNRHRKSWLCRCMIAASAAVADGLKHSYVRVTAVQVHNMRLRLSGACTGQKSCEAPSAAGCRWITW